MSLDPDASKSTERGARPLVGPALMTAFGELFESTWRRIVTKEVNALGKIIKKSINVADLINEFYDKHSAHVLEVLDPVLKVFGAEESQRQEETRKYIDDSRADILSTLQSGTSRDILDDWKENKAVRMTAEFLDRGKL